MMSEPPRRRAMRADIAQKRQAMEALGPISERIGPWQTKTARLLAQARKLRASGGHEPGLVQEAEALNSAVARHQEMLTQMMQELPPDVAADTRVLDTARALNSLSASLEEALGLMRQRVQ